MDQLRLLTVHAHPDDEASKGAGHRAPYHARASRCVLVCCTGGEAGDILNPAMDRPEVREQPATRSAWRSCAGPPRSSATTRSSCSATATRACPARRANADPRCFARADLDEAVGRLVEVIRRERPQVIVTYADDQEGYPHPDHLRVHDISVPAFDAAADPDAYPDAGAAVAAAEAVLRGLVQGPHRWPCTRSSSSWGSSRRSPRSGSSGPASTTASPPGSTSPARTTCAATPCWPTPPRSTPSRRSGSACRPRSPRRSTRTTTTSWPARWSTAPSPRTTCSPASASESR